MWALVKIIKFDVFYQLFTFLLNKQTFHNIFTYKKLERAWSGPDQDLPYRYSNLALIELGESYRVWP